MSREKLFALKLDSVGRASLKESAHKHVNGDQTRVKVVFGLNAEFRIIEPCVFNDGMFMDCREFMGKNVVNMESFLQECKRNNMTIYYPLNQLTYVCEQVINISGGNVVKSTVKLFVPSGLVGTDLKCNDVSLSFDVQNRNALANSCINYTLSRVQ